MSTDDTTPTPSPDGPPALSRRGLLAAAGAVGAAATAATVIGVSAASSASRTASTAGGSAAGADTAAGGTAAAHEDGAIVVHVRDLAAGTLDIFQGTEHRQLRDPELAAHLAAVARS